MLFTFFHNSRSILNCEKKLISSWDFFCRSPFLLDFQAFKVPHFESGHPVLLPGGGWTKIALSHRGRGGQGSGEFKRLQKYSYQCCWGGVGGGVKAQSIFWQRNLWTALSPQSSLCTVIVLTCFLYSFSSLLPKAYIRCTVLCVMFFCKMLNWSV